MAGDRRCPQCGAKNDAERARCRICASPLDVAAGASAFEPDPSNDPDPTPFVPFDVPGTPSATPPPRPRPEPPPQPSAASRRGSALVLVIACLVIGLGVGVYLGPGRSFLDSDRESTSSDSVQRMPSGAVKFSETAESIGGWVSFTDPDGYFSADFPGTPDPHQLPHPAPDRPPYTIWTSGNVGAARLFLDATVHPDLQEQARGVASQSGGTIRSIVESQDPSGHPTADSVIDLPDGTVLYQYLVLGDAELFLLDVEEPPGTSEGLADLLKLKVNFRILR